MWHFDLLKRLLYFCKLVKHTLIKVAALLTNGGNPNKPASSANIWPIMTQQMERVLIPSKHAKWSPLGGVVFRKRFVLPNSPKFRKNSWEARKNKLNEDLNFKWIQLLCRYFICTWWFHVVWHLSLNYKPNFQTCSNKDSN